MAGDAITSNAGLARRPCGGLRSLIATGFLVWRERRHAARASDELLALYRAASAIHPNFADRERYQLVVMTRTGCDAAAARVILDCAQDSFAEWPVRRELTLCDVAHYLSMTEFLKAHEGESWIHTNLALVVKARIPKELCVARRIP